MLASRQRSEGVSHRSRRAAGWLQGLLLLAASHALAQSAPEPTLPPPGEPTYTLHVYTDLLQVPTLVLNPLHAAWTGLTADDFALRVDSGPVFHPSSLHLEGSEPITLAIALDARGNHADVLRTLQPAIGALFHGGLLPHDHISVFAFDCELVRSLHDQPADPQTLKDGIAHALASPQLHATGVSTGACPSGKRLWDTLATVAADIGTSPGHRVLLVISDGLDEGSTNSWVDLEHLAGSRSVAIFGLRKGLENFAASKSGIPYTHVFPEDLFGTLCGSTGGLVLTANRRNLTQQLPRLALYVRQRYILEFPRPANGTPGLHQLDVALNGKRAIIHATGIEAPLRDADLLNDPSTVPRDSSRLPVQGTRSILTQPH